VPWRVEILNETAAEIAALPADMQGFFGLLSALAKRGWKA
jgi:hypothetical protein